MKSQEVRRLLAALVEERGSITQLRIFVSKEAVSQNPEIQRLLIEGWDGWDKPDGLARSVKKVSSHIIEKKRKIDFESISHVEYWGEKGGLLHFTDKEASEVAFFDQLVRDLQQNQIDSK